MDPRLVRAYDEELGYLRHTAREFGEEHEGIAGYLGLKSPAEIDPYVERLLEGVAFLSARVRLKLDDQFPDFTQHLLQAIQPNYLAPTPSIGVVELAPQDDDAGLARGITVPGGTQLTAKHPFTDLNCRFRTGHPVTHWPLRLEAVEYLPTRASVAKFSAVAAVKCEAGLRLTFRATAGLRLGDLAIRTLPLFIAGSEIVPGLLYHQIVGDTVAAVSVGEGGRMRRLAKPEAYGFSNECALLPHEGRSFRGYRILAEYFACPERFLFCELNDLDRAFHDEGETVEVVLLFGRAEAVLDRAVSTDNLKPWCTPIINLFEMQLDMVRHTTQAHEHQVIPDIGNVLNFEVFRITDAKVHDRSGRVGPAAPIHQMGSLLHDWQDAVFYTTRMRSRRLSTKEQRSKKRTDYIGTETWISLTCPGKPERLEAISEIALKALCTNREAPEAFVQAGKAPQFQIEAPSVKSVSLARALTRPRPPLGLHDAAWRVIGHLTPNYTSLVQGPGADGSALRDLLALYRQSDDPQMRRQIDGVVGVSSEPLTRRVSHLERSAFARGERITVSLDDSSFENGRMFLFAAVVDRFLGEFASINSFVESVFQSRDQGVFVRWPPRTGQRPTI